MLRAYTAHFIHGIVAIVAEELPLVDDRATCCAADCIDGYHTLRCHWFSRYDS